MAVIKQNMGAPGGGDKYKSDIICDPFYAPSFISNTTEEVWY